MPAGDLPPVADRPRDRPNPWNRLTTAISSVPLRTRIGLLVMAAVGLAVAGAALVNYFTVRTQVVGQLDNQLIGDTAKITNNSRYFDQNARLLDAQVLIFKPDGTTLYTNDAFDQNQLAFSKDSPEVRAAGLPEGTLLRTTVRLNGVEYRAVTESIYYSDSGLYTTSSYSGPASLVVAEDMTSTQVTLARIKLTSFLVGVAGIAVAGIAGFGIGRAGLQPVEDLTEAAEWVARTGDLRPIDVTGHDELARMATSFNSMLTALARSQEHQRRLVADAGHELRTPLTSLRTNLDLLAQSFARGGSGALSDKDRDELITDVRAQMEELSLLVADLVELSRDAPHEAVRQDLDVADIVNAAAERVRRRAPNVHFDLRLDSWYLHGEPAALERAVTNLLDNAAKWSPPDGTVTVTLSDGLLQVADEGPGIAEEDLAHVFERFYRSPEARTMPGSGLGLAIVRQTAENHGGRVAAARAPSGGALLGMWLPGQPAPPPPPPRDT